MTDAPRTFLDTNIMIRFLTNDDPAKADRVDRLLHEAAAGSVLLVTADIVIAELVWVLESFYHLGRKAIREKVEAILATPGLEVVNGKLVERAIALYSDFKVDFIDGYIVALMEKLDISGIYSFDKKHLSRFTLIQRIEP
ncbi:MAG: type II toxin-antitoxin system VapC family toxin [Desulfobacterales bacterium]|nr:type II toxin-antitoxin system VapC family toxin [Desulfobacterales bacterium]